MNRLKFGAFLAPHHPIGEHPMLQFRRDLDLVEQLDQLVRRRDLRLLDRVLEVLETEQIHLVVGFPHPRRQQPRRRCAGLELVLLPLAH